VYFIYFLALSYSVLLQRSYLPFFHYYSSSSFPLNIKEGKSIHPLPKLPSDVEMWISEFDTADKTSWGFFKRKKRMQHSLCRQTPLLSSPHPFIPAYSFSVVKLSWNQRDLRRG
jgi:hypothetical protein